MLLLLVYIYLIWRSLPRSFLVVPFSSQDSEPHCPVPQPKVSPRNLHGNKLVMNGAAVAMVTGLPLSLSHPPPLLSSLLNEPGRSAGLSSPGGVGGGVGAVRRESGLGKRDDGLNLQGNGGLLGCCCHGDRTAAC